MELNFQKIIIIIAIILLILALAFIATAITNEQKKTQFPPVISECPDYWKHDVENNNCENIHKLGIEDENGSKKDNLSLTTLNKLTMCEKFKDSNNLQISWDGITNNPKLINEC